MPVTLARRRFFQALAASVAAVSAPFPTGWPSDYPRAVSFFTHDSLVDVWTSNVGIVYNREQEKSLLDKADRRMPVTSSKIQEMV